jgi:hypothetical protein
MPMCLQDGVTERKLGRRRGPWRCGFWDGSHEVRRSSAALFPVNGSTTMVQGAEDGVGEDAAAPAWVMACATTAAVQFQVKSSWTEEDRC